jgi:hypothetical protein
MSMTVPTIPSLPAGHVVTLADMQALASAATFLLTKPIVLIEQVANGQAITTGLNTLNNFTSGGVIYDTDGMWSNSTPSRLTVQTPGWYRVCYGVNCNTTGGTYTTCLRSTTGSNNPAGAGVTSASHWGGYTNVTASSNPGYAGASGLWPAYLYVGDYLQIMMQAAATGTNTGLTAPGSANNGGSFFSMEWVSA